MLSFLNDEEAEEPTLVDLFIRGRTLLTPVETQALAAVSSANGLALKEGSSSTGNVLGMAMFYAIQAFLSFMIFSGMAFFANYLPTEIPKLNCCYRCYGGLVRFFMNIQIKLHYVTLGQIVLLWVSSLSNSCAYNMDFSVLQQPGGSLSLDKTQGIEADSLLQTCGMMWILMHVIGGIIRSMVYIEPYYDIPDDPDEPKWKVLLFQKCGP